MENQNITHLLSHISVICRKYEEIAEITGENFNVFKVLGLTTNEVRTHSAFLAELLNPKGSHGCKDVFLKLFVEEFNIKEFNTENAITQVEKHIGFINDKYTEGGYIDIIITSKDNHAIIIENKIYAGDQEKQLLRYHNYGNNFHSEKFKLLYLTLNGTEPANSSTHTLEKETHFLCISYKNDILNWLELCQKEAFAKPILRETIMQYINLIKHLTNQTTNNKMEKEIINKIIESPENIKSAFEIADNITKIQNAIIEKFKNNLKNKLEHKYKVTITNTSIFIIPEIWTYHRIEIYFDEGYGIGIYRNDDESIKDYLNKNNNTIDYNNIRNSLNIYLKEIGELMVNVLTDEFTNWLWLIRFNEFGYEEWESKNSDDLINNTIKKIETIIKTIEDNNINL